VNILLTGGTGYIGSHTAVILINAGHRVILFDNLSNSQRSVVGHLQTIVGKPVAFVHGDVRDTALVSATIKKYEIDSAIHFAGLKSVGESASKPVAYFSANVQGTISLLSAMQENQVKILVFSSSATVYGDPKYLPIDEAHPTSATNPYGRSKLHVEEMLLDLSKSDSGWRIACLRYFNPVGAHESALIGENPKGIPNNLMPFVARVALGKLPQLSVFGGDYATPDGTGVRDYIHVLDLAEGHLAALLFLKNNLGWHAINLGTGQGHSVLDMIRTFEAVSGKKITYTVVERRAGDVANCYAKSDKAKQMLGWEAKRTPDEMCRSAWQFQLNSEESTAD